MSILGFPLRRPTQPNLSHAICAPLFRVRLFRPERAAFNAHGSSLPMPRIARRTPGPDSQYTRVLCLSQSAVGRTRPVASGREQPQIADLFLTARFHTLSPTGRDGRAAPV